VAECSASRYALSTVPQLPESPPTVGSLFAIYF
jgi:hypothetical protein